MAQYADFNSLPPENIYESQESLRTALNQWSARRGYAWRIERSTKLKNGLHRSTYTCDRAGIPPSIERTRIRATTTRKTNCLFSIVAKEHSTGQWSISYRPDVKFHQHNHEPSNSTTCHPSLREITPEIYDIIVNMVRCGLSSHDIQRYIAHQYVE